MSRVSTDRPRETGAEDPDVLPGETGAAPDAETAAADASASSENVQAAADSPDGVETAEAPETAVAQSRRLPVLLLIAAVLLGLDLLTKTIVVTQMTPGKPIYLIGDWARLTLVRNPGAAFSMATGMTWVLTLIAAAVVIGVIRIGRTLRSLPWAIGLGMVLGGALGNLIDRLFRAPGPLQGHVVDFVAIGWWPVFNVADSSIVCGAILLVVLTVFGFELDGTRIHRQSAPHTEEKTA